MSKIRRETRVFARNSTPSTFTKEIVANTVWELAAQNLIPQTNFRYHSRLKKSKLNLKVPTLGLFSKLTFKMRNDIKNFFAESNSLLLIIPQPTLYGDVQYQRRALAFFHKGAGGTPWQFAPPKFGPKTIEKLA